MKEYDLGVLELGCFVLKRIEDGATTEQLLFDLGQIIHTLAVTSFNTIKVCYTEGSTVKVSLIADILQKSGA